MKETFRSIKQGAPPSHELTDMAIGGGAVTRMRSMIAAIRTVTIIAQYDTGR